MALGFDFTEIMDASADALSNDIRDMGTDGTHCVLQPIHQNHGDNLWFRAIVTDRRNLWD
jgi:hypothetical protein